MAIKNTIIKRYIVKWMMFISSYFPLYIMLLILHFDKYDSICEIKRVKVIIYLIVMIICISISLVSLVFLKVSSGNKKLIINELERPDDTIISYMMTYIIPILTTDLVNRGEIIVNIILFLLIGYLYIRLNLLYLNPLWSIFGYLAYRINSDVVVITNINYNELKLKRNSNKEIYGFYIANDIFVAQRKDN